MSKDMYFDSAGIFEMLGLFKQAAMCYGSAGSHLRAAQVFE